MTTPQALISISAIAIVTFLTRAIPFLAFPGNKPIPDFIKYLGQVLPFSVIGMLIVYCLKSIEITKSPFGIPECVSIICIIVVHKWKHKVLLSILSGTLLFMFLMQVVFNV